MLRRSWWLSIAFMAAMVTGARSETSASASVYYYAVPNHDNYLQPTVRADADRLHVEARYNYEGIHTISLWGGYAFTRSKKVELTFTPMLGLIAGDTSGMAPGAELTLGWKFVDFYTEGEYVYDFDHHADSFFYSWSELVAALPMKWRVGGALQRTQTYETPREFQGGVLVGTTFGRVQVTAHVFDLDLDDQTWVFSAAMEF
jgi:hypothetical protein